MSKINTPLKSKNPEMTASGKKEREKRESNNREFSQMWPNLWNWPLISELCGGLPCDSDMPGTLDGTDLLGVFIGSSWQIANEGGNTP